MSLRRITAAAVFAIVAACGPRPPNFAGLKTDVRSLTVQHAISVVRLTNGMQVAIVPDDRSNLVSVDVRYRVGADQDPVSRAGLAHLVEHLTFQAAGDDLGTPVFDRFVAVALGFNAYTERDVTHYTSTALADRVDALLELEARRLAAPCAAIPDGRFVRERDIVVAEQAQRASPWGEVMGEIDRAVWGTAHPYGHPVGSAEIARATQAEACAFIDRYYTPMRAILVVSGNVDPAALEPRIAARFGAISRGDGLPEPLAPIAPPRLAGTHSKHTGDVAHPTAVIVLPAPPWGAPDEVVHEAAMTVAGTALAELDAATPWIVGTDVGYGGGAYQRVTLVRVEVTDVGRLDAAVAAVMRAARGPLDEPDRDEDPDDNDDYDDHVVAQYLTDLRGALLAGAITATDRFGWAGDAVADYLTFTDHRDFAIARMRAADALTGRQLVDHLRALFVPARAHVARIVPRGQGVAPPPLVAPGAARAYDLPVWRTPVDPAAAARPEPLPTAPPSLAIDDVTLANGLRVLLYAEPRSLGFQARLLIPTGTRDEPADQPGVAWLAATYLRNDVDRDLSPSTRATIAWALRRDTRLAAITDEEFTTFTASGMALFGDWHLWRLAWLLDQGRYRARDLAAWRRALEGEPPAKPQTAAAAIRARMFGAQHPYGRARPAPAAVAARDVDQLAAWRRTQLGLAGATLIVSGSFEPAAMRAEVSALFGGLAAPPRPARAPQPAPTPIGGPAWFAIRDRAARQVTLTVNLVAASDRVDDRAARQVLAAMAEDRLREVREGLGASYAVSSGYDVRAAASVFVVRSALAPDRAPRAAVVIREQLAALRAAPASAAADFVRARRRLVAQALASSTEATAVAARLAEVVRHGGDLHRLTTVASDLAAITLDQVAAVAQADLDPARMVVSIDGPPDAVQATLAALGATDAAWFDE